MPPFTTAFSTLMLSEPHSIAIRSLTMNIKTLAASLALSILSGFAYSGVLVSFTESAPKDSFSFTNVSECLLTDMIIVIDMSGGAGQLVFDTAPAGKGVEVFQPFENVKGVSLVSGSGVKDGDQSVTVRIAKLEPGGAASFTIDVDDSLENSKLGNIRITGSEMEGSTVTLTFNDNSSLRSEIGVNNEALVAIDACPQ